MLREIVVFGLVLMLCKIPKCIKLNTISLPSSAFNSIAIHIVTLFKIVRHFSNFDSTIMCADTRMQIQPFPLGIAYLTWPDVARWGLHLQPLK